MLTIRRRSTRVLTFAAVAALAMLGGCDRARDIAERVFDNRTPRERYVARLEAAGLATSPLARDWIEGVTRALREAPVVTTPHEEQGYLAPSAPVALAYRLQVKRGQQLAFDFTLLGDTTTLVFIEAWEPSGDAAAPLQRVATADSGTRTLSVLPRRDGALVVVVQAELLRGGRFTARLRVAPTLAFPVRGGQETDIGSRFGDSREGGVRRHHGIDIFARRGTPVVAAADAHVSRVETTVIGGKVVWLRDALGHSIYYAHLDSQRVTTGMMVRTGDTVGFVGNTGNARTTPPHLHFGVYRRGEGPVDPHWYVVRPRATPVRLVADTSVLGDWVRVPRDGVVLRAAPSVGADSVRALAQHTAVTVLAAVGEWHRVALPDGTTGYMLARSAEAAGQAVRVANVFAPTHLLARPSDTPGTGEMVERVGAGETVDVHGEFGDFLLVRSRSGYEGWLRRGTAE